MKYYILNTEDNAIGGLFTQEDVDGLDNPRVAPEPSSGEEPIAMGDHWNGTTWVRAYPGRTQEALRDHRDTLLSRTDYTQLASYSGSDAVAWESYRQELRDLPSNYIEGDEIVYPINPAPE
jgi:hypothetical protein